MWLLTLLQHKAHVLKLEFQAGLVGTVVLGSLMVAACLRAADEVRQARALRAVVVGVGALAAH